MTTYAVIDFETTGLSPAHGARPTEVGICLVEGGRIVDHYQSLMNPGVPIPYEIQGLTGITDAMVRAAPPVSTVMAETASFVGDRPLLAHNAAFDRKFWEVELKTIEQTPRMDMACSLLLSRRLFPTLPNHRLATLVRSLRLPMEGTFHRALADAECTAHLLIRIQEELQGRFKLATVDHALLMAIQKASKHDLDNCVGKYCGIV
ncbi:MAG TPA: DNA polymerase III subunit epsilon [Gammaproteobacteria bacterium]|nr:DNA polymerase III subunit epsilon [Gammaproteobacteria bacterium]